jgi:NADP-dependent 3-hydroxy acid dehydrogenase YdfG
MKNNKTVIITGGGTGIGKGIALKLAKHDFNIILASRNISNLEKVKDECTKLNNQNVITVQTDVTDIDSVSNLFKIAKEKFEKLDVLINNAGVFDGAPLDTLDIETWDKVLNINLRGAFLCLREAMKIMKPQKNGKIINIGSISGQVPRLYSTPYTTSKFALTGLTKAAALEAREHNISVSIIHPGNVITELRQIRDEDKDSEPMMNPESIAELIYLSISLPNNVNLLESIMLPIDQLYIGRG